MKKTYQTPELQLIRIDDLDILTTSGVDGTGNLDSDKDGHGGITFTRG